MTENIQGDVKEVIDLDQDEPQATKQKDVMSLSNHEWI